MTRNQDSFFRTFLIVLISTVVIVVISLFLPTGNNSSHLGCEGTSCSIHKPVIVDGFIDLLGQSFNTSNWPPRWQCGIWSGFQGWMSVISDLVIFISYIGIPLFLIYYLTKKKKSIAPFKRLVWLFSAFIISCGITHLTDAIIFWVPIYNFGILSKLLTAGISFATLIALIYSIDSIIKLRGPSELQKVIDERTAELNYTNDRLLEEIERKQTYEKSLQAALDSNESLFLELHHRVKNNLQLLMNLLHLNFNDRPERLELVNSRIKSMSQVHELLLKSKSINEVGVREYLKTLLGSLKESASIPNLSLDITIPEDIILNTEKITVMGMVITEAFTNSVKYAFGNHEAPSIALDAQVLEGNLLQFLFSDNGKGYDIAAGESVEKDYKIGGKELIDTFISSLAGTAVITSSLEEGTVLKITIPL